MAYKTVSEDSLRRGGFSAPASASCYYPDHSPATHMHLGVPTSAGGSIAPTGTRFVTFISLKVNDANVGRLEPDASGNYKLSQIPAGKWPAGWKDQLRACLGPMIQP